MEHFVYLLTITQRVRKPIKFKGVVYPSMKHLTEHLNCTYKIVYRLLKNGEAVMVTK